MPEEQKELKNSTIALMASVALFYDVLQWLLAFIFMGWLVIPIAYLTFWMWFRTRGVKFFTLKRAPSMGVGVFLEILSAGIIPSITFNVLRCALDYKVKKVLSQVPGGNIALSAVDQKMTKGRDQQAVNKMDKATPMSNNNEMYARMAKDRGESNKRFSDEASNKRRKESDEHFERIRQSGQRQDELRYGGGTKEGLEQHQAQQKKAWDIGTGKVRPDGSAYSK